MSMASLKNSQCTRAPAKTVNNKKGELRFPFFSTEKFMEILQMKNLILIAVMLSSQLALAAESTLVCRGTGGRVKAAVKVNVSYCRIHLRSNGIIDRLWCTANGRYNTSETQIFVSRQDNELTALSHVINVQTGRADFPVETIEISSERNVLCRLQ
jgi:hypothetical protein